jgi:integrase
MQVVILLLASSGIRIGVIPSLRAGNLDNQKLIVYENSSEEYFTFITIECRKAIDLYLDMTKLYGEELDKKSWLIREQFDVSCPAKPKQLKREVLQYKLYDLCKRRGIETGYCYCTWI